MPLNDKQKRKITKLANLVEKGELAVVEHLFEVEEKLDETLEKIETRFIETVKEIKQDSPNLNEVLKSVKGQDGKDGNKGEKGDKGDKGDLPTIDELEAVILPLIPEPKNGVDGKDGRDGKDGIDGLNGLDGKDGKDGSPDTAVQVRDKLESLEGDERLDAKAIKGLEDKLTSLGNTINKTIASIPRGFGGVNSLKVNNFIEVHKLTFTGATVTQNGHDVTVAITGGSGGHTIQDEGTPLTARANLNFVGSGVTVTDDAGNDATVVTIGGGGSTAWGDITGTLSDQTDLQTALDGKVDENGAITGATKTKITYDAKGLVTAGADATTADIADSSNKRYVTDAQLTVIGNTSGTNTGDQTSVTGNAGTATALQTARTIGTITGDATSAGSSFDGTANNTNALTLATVNANVGSFGSATAAPAVTVNAKGLVTAVSTNTITPAVGSITGLGTGVATALAVNVGSSGAFVTQNGALGTPSSGTITNLTGTATGATVGNALLKESIVFGVDGGGSAVSTGQIKAFRTAVYAGTITAWKITVDTGTATVKFWKVATGTSAPTISNVINTSGVSLSSGTMIRSTTLTDFTTTTVSANDTFGCDITAISGATFITIELEITRT